MTDVFTREISKYHFGSMSAQISGQRQGHDTGNYSKAISDVSLPADGLMPYRMARQSGRLDFKRLDSRNSVVRV
jgi:hypothetical protein